MLNPKKRPMVTILIVEGLLAIGASVVAYFALRENMTLLILTALAAIAALLASKFNLWAFGAAAVFGGAVQSLFEQESLRFWSLIALFFIGWVFDQFGNWWYDRKHEIKKAPPSAARNISFAMLPIGVSLALVYALMREDFSVILNGHDSWTDLMLTYAKAALLAPYIWIGLAAAFREINFDVRQVKRFFRQLRRSYIAVALAVMIFVPFAFVSPFIFGLLFELFAETVRIPTDQGDFVTVQLGIYLPAIVSVLAAGWGARWNDVVPGSAAIEPAAEVLEGELIEETEEAASEESAEEEKKEGLPKGPWELLPSESGPSIDGESTLLLDTEEENVDKMDELYSTVIDDPAPDEGVLQRIKKLFSRRDKS